MISLVKTVVTRRRVGRVRAAGILWRLSIADIRGRCLGTRSSRIFRSILRLRGTAIISNAENKINLKKDLDENNEIREYWMRKCEEVLLRMIETVLAEK